MSTLEFWLLRKSSESTMALPTPKTNVVFDKVVLSPKAILKKRKIKVLNPSRGIAQGNSQAI